MRVQGGPVGEGLFPPGLECRGQHVAHGLRDVGVEAAHAGNLVAQALFGQDLWDAVLDHPGLWLCRRPCGVSPGLTGSQQARGVSSAGSWQVPEHC